eukprot:6267130-Pyramimonas_sp.AAC.1
MDVSGWNGPAAVIKMSPENGTVTANYGGVEQFCRLGDARRFMDFSGLVYGVTSQPATPRCQAWMVVEQYITSLSAKTFQRFGLAGTSAITAITTSQ